ncbi:MAG: MFS transporter [Candidatus Synoicihabitans palmerolidicus]|nr:MFS transporter [Candidatus Synoicihabitans palmerolidicus]MCC5025753.1 MFS transporter [Candidatus Synoicihabitans palmerolidicus]
MNTPPPSNFTPLGVGSPRGRFRWVICTLLFLATTINYMDRQVLGVLKPALMGELSWSEIDYSNIIAAFPAASAIGYALGGWMMDRLGVRVGLMICVCWAGVWLRSDPRRWRGPEM